MSASHRSAVSLVLLSLIALPQAAAGEPPAPPYEPTSQYEKREVEGWQVQINKRLAADDSQQGRRALDLIRIQLRQIATLLPAGVVEQLQEVPIWLDDDPKNRIHYHPERQWLVDNGFNPDRAQAVDIGRADRLLEYYRDQPYVLLHELAHAYHHQMLGFGDPRIRRAFEQAKAGGNYESVLKSSGREGRHYALSNHKEYFAESTEAFFGTNDFYPFVRAELKRHDPRMYQLLQEIWLTEVTAPPERERKRLKLTGFYEKYVSAVGIPIVSSAKVSDTALLEAAYIVNRMLEGRDDIRQAIVDSGTRVVIMAPNEFTTDVPEHGDLQPKEFWDRRARGLGATPQRPAISCGEENLLSMKGDPYAAENILVHEFAHTIHHMGLVETDREFGDRLAAVFDQAMTQGLWKEKYAASNRAEYWAEGVQSYFGTNREDDHDHNHVNTRDELREYDGRLFALVDDVFGGNTWQYSRPQSRAKQPHLANLDRSQLPKFSWPKRLRQQTLRRNLPRQAAEQDAASDEN